MLRYGCGYALANAAALLIGALSTAFEVKVSAPERFQ
jgi:hypothetical protein